MAQPFKFKLQTVLDYRLQLEDQAKLVLARIQRKYQAQVGIVKGIEQRIEDTECEYCSREVLSAAEVWLWQACRDNLNRELEQAQVVLSELAKELQKARTYAIERSKERKLLEKLKENQAEKHVKEDALAQQKEFDETATLRFQHPHIPRA